MQTIIWSQEIHQLTLSDHLALTQQRHSSGVTALHKHLNPAYISYFFAVNRVNKNFDVSK